MCIQMFSALPVANQQEQWEKRYFKKERKRLQILFKWAEINKQPLIQQMQDGQTISPLFHGGLQSVFTRRLRSQSPAKNREHKLGSPWLDLLGVLLT